MYPHEHPLLEVDGKIFTYEPLFIDLPRQDLLNWLNQQNFYPKVYWKEKETGKEHAAVGSLLKYSHIPNISSHSSPHARFFGGKGSASSSFWLPEFEVIQDKERTYLQINFINHSPSPRAMSRLSFDTPLLNSEETRWETREDNPSEELWHEEIKQALFAFNEGPLKKVVLARQTHLTGDRPWNPWNVLHTLKLTAKEVTFFCFAFSQQEAFLGATPEHLYTRQGLHLTGDAIAGTRPSGLSEEETFFLKASLLSSEKDLEEFSYVRTSIDALLAPLCAKKQWELETRTLSTGSVIHLYDRFSATLNSKTSDEELIETLHPTPAIGGFPRKEALAFLKMHEPFERKWYAQPIGFLSSDRSEIAIGIRSAHIQETLITLFAGAGIVEGSDAQTEWEELEYKISPFMRSFACALKVN